MEVNVLKECGYEEATFGFSLSYNTLQSRAQELLPSFAFKQGGENKFLEGIMLWLYVRAPRYWWSEADTYRISTKQSESTMHTLLKKELSFDKDFEHLPEEKKLGVTYRSVMQLHISLMNATMRDEKLTQSERLRVVKGMLPESFLQARVWVMSYKTVQNIISQRRNHKLPQWDFFLTQVLRQVKHPEFLVID